MIEEDDYWVWSCSETNQLADPHSAGKWIVRGLPMERLWGLIKSIDELVEEGSLHQAKFSRGDPDHDWERNQTVLCIYADNPTKGETLRILREELDLKANEWKYG